MFKWMITKDIINAGRLNKKSFNFPDSEITNLTNKFKLYDDDDNLYFEGIAQELGDDDDPEDEFNPLDWAMNDCGCTYIKYYNKKTKAWDTL